MDDKKTAAGDSQNSQAAVMEKNWRLPYLFERNGAVEVPEGFRSRWRTIDAKP